MSEPKPKADAAALLSQALASEKSPTNAAKELVTSTLVPVASTSTANFSPPGTPALKSDQMDGGGVNARDVGEQFVVGDDHDDDAGGEAPSIDPASKHVLEHEVKPHPEPAAFVNEAKDAAQMPGMKLGMTVNSPSTADEDADNQGSVAIAKPTSPSQHQANPSIDPGSKNVLAGSQPHPEPMMSVNAAPALGSGDVLRQPLQPLDSIPGSGFNNVILHGSSGSTSDAPSFAARNELPIRQPPTPINSLQMQTQMQSTTPAVSPPSSVASVGSVGSVSPHSTHREISPKIVPILPPTPYTHTTSSSTEIDPLEEALGYSPPDPEPLHPIPPLNPPSHDFQHEQSAARALSETQARKLSASRAVQAAQAKREEEHARRWGGSSHIPNLPEKELLNLEKQAEQSMVNGMAGLGLGGIEGKGVKEGGIGGKEGKGEVKGRPRQLSEVEVRKQVPFLDMWDTGASPGTEEKRIKDGKGKGKVRFDVDVEAGEVGVEEGGEGMGVGKKVLVGVLGVAATAAAGGAWFAFL